MRRSWTDAEIPRPSFAKDVIPTIFHEPWWLKLVGGGNEQEVTVESGGKIVGRLLYLRSKVLGLTTLRMPALAHVLGPAVWTLGSATSRFRRDFAITSQLIGQLPRAAHVHARLHGGICNTLAFEAAGYRTGVDFTIEIEPTAPETLWKQMRDKNRNAIRRARDRLEVLDILDAGRFIDFYDDNLRSRALENFYSRPMLASIIGESLNRGAGRILSAVDGSGGWHAAIFTVWDEQVEYYFMSTRRLQSDNGAVSLLIWTAIRHAHERNLTFDMDGLHVLGHSLPNYLLLSGFGGTVRPRYLVSRSSAIMTGVIHMRRILSR